MVSPSAICLKGNMQCNEKKSLILTEKLYKVTYKHCYQRIDFKNIYTRILTMLLNFLICLEIYLIAFNFHIPDNIFISVLPHNRYLEMHTGSHKTFGE